MPLIPALGRQRQVDFCDFEASLVYRANSRATQRNPISEKTNKQTNKNKKENKSRLEFIKNNTFINIDLSMDTKQQRQQRLLQTDRHKKSIVVHILREV